MSGMMEGQANTSIPLVDDNDPLLPLRLRMDEIGSNLDLDVLMDRMISKEPSSLDRVTRSRSRERLIRSPSRDHRRSRSPPRDLYRRSRSPSGNLYRGSRSPGNLYRSSKSPSWDINRSRSPYRDHRRSKSRSRDRRRRSSSWDKRSDRSNDWRNSRDCHSHSRTSRRKLVVDGRNPGNQMSHVEQDNRTLFIMQMSSTVSTRELEAFFSAVGDVRDVRMIQAPVCLAYVQFEDLESVPRALQLSGRKLFGEAVIIKPTQVSITQIVRATTQHQMETPKPTKTRQSSPPRLAPGPSWTAGSRPINIHHSIPSRPQESSLRTIPKRSTYDDKRTTIGTSDGTIARLTSSRQLQDLLKAGTAHSAFVRLRHRSTYPYIHFMHLKHFPWIWAADGLSFVVNLAPPGQGTGLPEVSFPWSAIQRGQERSQQPPKLTDVWRQQISTNSNPPEGGL